jgi:hypothetical protein
VTYTLLLSGLTATPIGTLAVATVRGSFGVSAPPAPTEYCDTVLSEGFVTYTLAPSGLTASRSGSVPAATVTGDRGESRPPNASYWDTSCDAWFAT